LFLINLKYVFLQNIYESNSFSILGVIVIEANIDSYISTITPRILNSGCVSSMIVRGNFQYNVSEAVFLKRGINADLLSGSNQKYILLLIYTDGSLQSTKTSLVLRDESGSFIYSNIDIVVIGPRVVNKRIMCGIGTNRFIL
jgi:hypothetical protein